VIIRRFLLLLPLGAVLMGLAATRPALAAAAPPSGQAYYMYGSTVTGLGNEAAADACDFATNQPDNQTEILLLDFGAARIFPDGSTGTIDFSNTSFKTASILLALKKAADGYHNCHVKGGVIIELGNSNYHMSNVGMSNADAWNAGYDQEQVAEDLSDYQIAHGYSSQGSGAGSDMEPSYDGQLITKQLVNGASAQGWSLYDDYGSVDGCPTSGSSNGPCNNGWDVSDVGYVSFHGLAMPLPEIYYAVSASQWTVVRKVWDATHTQDYFFDGVLGETPAPPGGISAAAAWNLLNSKNPGLVGYNLVCFGSGC
jgi:hypothetical protein